MTISKINDQEWVLIIWESFNYWINEIYVPKCVGFSFYFITSFILINKKYTSYIEFPLRWDTPEYFQMSHDETASFCTCIICKTALFHSYNVVKRAI